MAKVCYSPRRLLAVSHHILNKLTIETRLLIQDKWQYMMSITPLSCCLCSNSDETRDHLFIDCSFSRDIWRRMLLKLSDPGHHSDSWMQLLAWTSSPPSKSLRTLRSIAVLAIIYNIWAERNNRIFKNQMENTSDLFEHVNRNVRNTISARRQESF